MALNREFTTHAMFTDRTRDIYGTTGRLTGGGFFSTVSRLAKKALPFMRPGLQILGRRLHQAAKEAAPLAAQFLRRGADRAIQEGIAQLPEFLQTPAQTAATAAINKLEIAAKDRAGRLGQLARREGQERLGIDIGEGMKRRRKKATRKRKKPTATGNGRPSKRHRSSARSLLANL
jgi:hypothetical protein